MRSIASLAARAAFAASCAVAGVAMADTFPVPLPAETIPKVEMLPQKYPSGWAFLNYAGDRIELRNVGSDSREVKGQLQAHGSAATTPSLAAVVAKFLSVESGRDYLVRLPGVACVPISWHSWTLGVLDPS